MGKRAFRKRSGRRRTVARKQRFIERARVHANADRHMMRLCAVHKRAHIRFAPDVSRVEADLVDPVLDGCDRKPVIKVDVRNERNLRARADLPHGLSRSRIVHRHAHDLAARFRKLLHLRHGGFHIPRVCICHRLHGNGCIRTHPYSADPDGSCSVPHFSHRFSVFRLFLFLIRQRGRLQARAHR